MTGFARPTEEMHAAARLAVADLHGPNPRIFWTDLVVTAGLGWAGLAIAVSAPPLSWLMWMWGVVAVLAFYRGLCFMHELSHIRRGALNGYETVWNVGVGIPLLMPSTMYVGVHQDHHKLSTYGTEDDPEYLPFARSSSMTTRFVLGSLLVPAFLFVRGVLLVPAELFSSRVHAVLASRASSFAMNPKYRRPLTPSMSRRIRQLHAATCITWLVAVGMAAAGVLPWRFFVIWYVVTAVASLVNTLRTLAAHHYESDGAPMTREQQLLDSIDTPGAFWTELWAPVGLRYHALHHYFPGIPYHNLPEAYRRLVGAAPDYRGLSGAGLLANIVALYEKGREREMAQVLSRRATG